MSKKRRRTTTRTAQSRPAQRRTVPAPPPPAAPRRSALRILLGIVVAGAVLAAAYGIEVFLHRTSGPERALLGQAPAAAAGAGCTPVQTVRPYPRGLDRTHIGGSGMRAMPVLSSYPSTPPASGPHAPVPLDAGVYGTPPPIDQVIHSLEHAAVIVWYDPSAARDPALAAIRAFFAQGGERNHVVVAPYDYPFGGVAGHLPSGRRMAVVAWHRLQVCDQPSLPVAYAFVHAYRFDLWQPTAYKGVAPEKYTPI